MILSLSCGVRICFFLYSSICSSLKTIPETHFVGDKYAVDKSTAQYSILWASSMLVIHSDTEPDNET